MKRLIPIAALCLVCGCMSMRGWSYSGDGEFRACPSYFSPGYSVTFPSFPTDRPYVATYKFSSLPLSPEIYLCFHSDDTSDADKAQVTARMHVKLTDSYGRIINSFDLPLEKAGWMRCNGLVSAYGDQSHLHFEPLLKYVLQVSYDPGTRPLPAKEAFFKIDACAQYE